MIKGECLPDSVHHYLAGLGRYLRKPYVRWKTGRGKRGERVGASEHSHRFVHECHRTRVRIASTSVFGPVQHDRGVQTVEPRPDVSWLPPSVLVCDICITATTVTYLNLLLTLRLPHRTVSVDVSVSVSMYLPSLHPQVSTNIGREGLMVWGSIRLPSLWKVNDLLNIN